jgi:hypothetical protein
MILYLVKSTLCLALLSAVYFIFLEKEKMHRFKRIYLLFGLVFSLMIPLFPIGMIDNFIGLGMNSQSAVVNPGSNGLSTTVEGSAYNRVITTESAISGILFPAIIFIYGLTALILFVRLICKIDSILLKVRRNPRFLYDDAVIVLLKEKTNPFSFLGYIFLNEQEYRQGKIRKEVLVHESIHVRQKHTLDILFIEFLKTFFWFNPVLYFYKKAIQLNHEFLADEVVISGSVLQSDYQFLLLKTTLLQNRHVLASNFNFSMTKKRLMMMTQKTSRTRSIIKLFSMLPLLAGAALLFGCQATTLETEADELTEHQTVRLEIIEADIIKIDGEEISVSMLQDRLASLAQSADLIVEFRVQPDAYFGTVLNVQKILREYSLKINYSTERVGSANERGELENALASFKDSVNRYMLMPVRDTTLEALQKEYDQVMKLYNAFHEKQIEIHLKKNMEAPPPPPVPPKPEKRLEIEIE